MEASDGSIDALTDDNLADILVRLDAVSVLRRHRIRPITWVPSHEGKALFALRCRAVCKSWRRVATDRSFLAAHAAGRPREMIIKTKYGYARSTVPLSSPTDDDLDTMTAASDDVYHHRYLFDPSRTPADGDGISSEFELHASLDGLLVLGRRGSYPPTYVICNPVTRQWANLPSPFTASPEPLRRGVLEYRNTVACGFYFHAWSREYRLLLHCESGALPRDLERYCCVVSVGSTHMPRRLAQAPPSKDLFPCYAEPVSYRGTLHWLLGHPDPEPEESSTGEILAFDTTSETFRLMPRPPEALEPTTKARSDLLELDGELSVATIYWSSNGTMLDVWALQDYEAEQWTLRHRLKVQRPPRSGGSWKRPIIMAMGNAPRGRSSAILVGFPETNKVVMVYSLKDCKVRKKISFGSFLSIKVFGESLVPHAFFDSTDTRCH